MKTFFKNIGNTIVKKLRKHPLICNLVLSVVLAFVLEVLGRLILVLWDLWIREVRCFYIASLLFS